MLVYLPWIELHLYWNRLVVHKTKFQISTSCLDVQGFPRGLFPREKWCEVGLLWCQQDRLRLPPGPQGWRASESLGLTMTHYLVLGQSLWIYLLWITYIDHHQITSNRRQRILKLIQLPGQSCMSSLTHPLLLDCIFMWFYLHSTFAKTRFFPLFVSKIGHGQLNPKWVDDQIQIFPKGGLDILESTHLLMGD